MVDWKSVCLTHKEGVRLTEDRLATGRRAVEITAMVSAEVKVRTNRKTNGQ